MHNLCQELRERRNKLGLSQAKLCKFLKIPLATYEKIESGRRAVPKTQAYKLNVYKHLRDEDVLIAIYHKKTIKDLYTNH
ncbi:helix-turn-helix domain-containing protein (plasmid) [Cytobacillus spongiae]|uniref:helix-turn-helix domain-containing protein n=1 Tax=Cytobacillus spongiae TaxID=2901381 RepID=UPI001F218E06|nr:helix-turn-helix transcriptional regulator [Cytobacillus spongiae]UII58158.1 helix-turn-helix domain-containing protein [Cytobacillus spongiae]